MQSMLRILIIGGAILLIAPTPRGTSEIVIAI
jgi:hypothetical protein